MDNLITSKKKYICYWIHLYFLVVSEPWPDEVKINVLLLSSKGLTHTPETHLEGGAQFNSGPVSAILAEFCHDLVQIRSNNGILL